MSHKPVESDKRTRVDRMLDHIKNNPVTPGIGLAALASFTESTVVGESSRSGEASMATKCNTFDRSPHVQDIQGYAWDI